MGSAGGALVEVSRWGRLLLAVWEDVSFGD